MTLLVIVYTAAVSYLSIMIYRFFAKRKSKKP